MCEKDLPYQQKCLCIDCHDNLRFTHFEQQGKNAYINEIFYGRVYLNLVLSLLYFKTNSSTQNILHQIKYNHGKELAIYLGQLMAEKWKASPHFEAFDGIIPVSLHEKKHFKRGYNQSKLLAQGLSEVFEIPIYDKVLYKGKHNSSQTKKSRAERIDNVRKVFYVKHAESIANKHILLVDDVLTTGATLEACALTLKESVPNLTISIYTLAYAQ
ncbi:ComF family protein [Lishizhenia tianjinensis]|uniref:ComF family protein n=1 Tax=Lishizhenia tianjinensis TaxID=477690 RepID=UPI0011140DB4|nr:phosphoribosyltransferase family protein [Lishizhenia tianjinensis]